MSLLTNINGVPLFSTIQEALNWGASYGLSGYHTHQYQGQTGYMGGTTHGQASTSSSGFNGNNNQTNTPPASSSSGFSGGGGGY